MDELPDPVSIGAIVGAHGVGGTVRVRPSGSGRHLREGADPVVDGLRRRIISVRETPKGFLLDLEGVTDREHAAGLRGQTLQLDRRELDSPPEGEFYVGDLVGLAAFDEGGGAVGEVAETFDTGAHEVLVVRGADGAEVFVPFTLEHVPDVDLGSRRLVVRPPEE